MSNEAKNSRSDHLGQQVERRDGQILPKMNTSLSKWDIVLGIVCSVAVVFVWLLWSRTQAVREDELLHLHDAWLVGRVCFRIAIFLSIMLVGITFLWGRRRLF